MADELDRDHQSVASSSGGGETPPPLAVHTHGRGAEHGLREGAGGDSTPARDTRPDRATRFIETARGVLSNYRSATTSRALSLNAVAAASM